MATQGEWKIPAQAQPRPADYGYDLDRALSAVLALSARVPESAFTAETLGTERAGNGVVIREDGLVLTIGYLVTEADSVWLTTRDGRSVPGHVVGFDAATGFGLVQALGDLGVPALPLGRSAGLKTGDRAVLAGAGGRQRCVAVEVVARQEFAGYWEYVLDEALFTAPVAPALGRHRADRPPGRPARHRLAAAAAGRLRQRAPDQHGGADRPAAADPRRPRHAGAGEPAAAPLARPLRHRERGGHRGDGAG